MLEGRAVSGSLWGAALNVNEFGITFAFSTAFNMSGFSTIAIHFEKPNGTTLVVTDSDGVTVPSMPVTTTLGVFLANKYVTYTFQDGDVDEEGLWSCRVVYDDATPQHLISDVGTFTVDP